MNAHAKHSTRKLQLGLLALAACLVTGCWEEIHYAPPPGGEAARRQPRYEPPEIEIADGEVLGVAAPEDSDDNFAADVATKLDTAPDSARYAPTPGEPPSAGGDTAATDTTSTESEPLFGEPEPPRYTESPAPDTGPPPATATSPVVEPRPPRYAETAPHAPAINSDQLRYREPTLPSTTPTPAPSTATSNAPNPASNTRRVAWLLGSKLSLAALARDRDANAAEVAKWFGQSQALGKLVSVQVDPLPAADAPTNAGIEYVFNQGQRIGRELDSRYDPVHAALFELAAKSYVLIVVYQPHDPAANALGEAIASAGQRAKLPPELFAPMLKSVRRGEPRATVRQAVLELNRTLDQQLNAPDARS